MIEQYLLNKNESAAVSNSKIFLHVNKALVNSKNKNFLRFFFTSNLVAHVQNIKYR